MPKHIISTDIALLVPTQTGQGGKYLTTDGTTTTWGTVAAGLTIGGSTTHVQYNNAGALEGSSKFIYDGATVTLQQNVDTTPLLRLKRADGTATYDFRIAGTTNNPSIYIGQLAGTNATGTSNIFIGRKAGELATTASNSIIIGDSAARQLTTHGSNTIIGSYAFDDATLGVENVLLGLFALSNTSAGHNNVAIGVNAGGGISTPANIPTNENVLIGGYNLYQTAGAVNNNTAQVVGNTIVGYNAGRGANGVKYATYLGWSAGYSAYGFNNLFLGYKAGYTTTLGTKNIIIGNELNASSATVSNFLNIGGIIFGAAINEVTGTSISAGRIMIGTATDDGTNKLQVGGSLLVSGNVKVSTMPSYNDNAAAVTGGLTAGQFYKDSSGFVRIVL